MSSSCLTSFRRSRERLRVTLKKKQRRVLVSFRIDVYSNQLFLPDPGTSQNSRRGTIPPLHTVETFMLSLTGMDEGENPLC